MWVVFAFFARPCRDVFMGICSEYVWETVLTSCAEMRINNLQHARKAYSLEFSLWSIRN